MDRNELLQRINNRGKVQGYPLFVMSDGRILKTPPQDEPFKFMVFEELNIKKSLQHQGIMKYETWLRRTPNVASTPQNPEKAYFPKKFSIPSHLEPKIYCNGKVYIYAEYYVRYRVETDRTNGREGIAIYFLQAGVAVDQCTIIEKGIKKTYYYLH